MKPQRWLCLFLTGVGWFLDPASGRAQPRAPELPRRPYVQIPFEGDLDRTLADQLLRARDVAELKALVDQVQKNPGAFPGMPATVPKFDFDDPAMRATMRKLLHQQPDLFKVSPEQMKALQRILKKEAKAEPAPAENKNPAPSESPEEVPPPPEPQPPPGASPPEDRSVGEDLLARWTRDFLEEAETWDLDDLVKDSAALQGGLRDLQDLLASKDGNAGRFDAAALGRWAERLRPRENWSFTLPDMSWVKAPELSLPSLPRPNFRWPRPGPWGEGRAFGLSLPRLGAPLLGQGLGRAALWLVGLGLAALVFWQIVRLWRDKTLRQARPGWSPGPWPVNPAQVATRAELVQAFEYLSLLRLGPGARSANHRMLAARLGEDGSARRLAADELADFYERARYAPAAEPLPAGALESARCALCLLAGVAIS